MTVPHSGLLEWKLKDRFVNVAAARLTRDNLSSRISRHLDFFVKKPFEVLQNENARTKNFHMLFKMCSIQLKRLLGCSFFLF